MNRRIWTQGRRGAQVLEMPTATWVVMGRERRRTMHETRQRSSRSIRASLREGWREWKIVSGVSCVIVLVGVALLLLTSLPPSIVLWGSFVGALVVPPLILSWGKRPEQ